MRDSSWIYASRVPLRRILRGYLSLSLTPPRELSQADKASPFHGSLRTLRISLPRVSRFFLLDLLPRFSQSLFLSLSLACALFLRHNDDDDDRALIAGSRSGTSIVASKARFHASNNRLTAAFASRPHNPSLPSPPPPSFFTTIIRLFFSFSTTIDEKRLSLLKTRLYVVIVALLSSTIISLRQSIRSDSIVQIRKRSFKSHAPLLYYYSPQNQNYRGGKRVLEAFPRYYNNNVMIFSLITGTQCSLGVFGCRLYRYRKSFKSNTVVFGN